MQKGIITLLLGTAVLLSAANFEAILDSSDGSSGFEVKDSTSTTQCIIDSDGNIVTSGGISVGAGTGTSDGTIRYTGSDFEGRKSGVWVSLTPPAYVVLKDEKSQGMGAGNSDSSTWTDRDLTIEQYDGANICTFTPPTFSLPAGTYRVSISVPGHRCGWFTSRLWNNTDGALLLSGSHSRSDDADKCLTRSEIVGVITLPATKQLSVQQRSAASVPNGYGEPSGLAVETYTVVEIWKIN